MTNFVFLDYSSLMEDIERTELMINHGKIRHLTQVIIKAKITFPNAMHLHISLETSAMKRSRSK
ncbi:MAG: hypothetical protein DYG89_49405 [Caldilinea sp. CFX5]|nr:hypothetical protein [Caldilinea sp. CFX5]